MLVTLNDLNWLISLLQKLEEHLTKFQKFKDVIMWQFIKFVAALNDLEVNKIHQSTQNFIASNIY